MRYFIFISLMLFAGSIYSQNIQNSISGRITDKTTGKALPNVNIFISGTNYGNVSNAEGSYEVKSVPTGRQKLTFSLIGYESISVILEVSDDSKIIHNVELTPRTYSTETVEIKSERGLDRPALMNIFREQFLGKSVFSDSCYILNEKEIKASKSYGNTVDFSSESPLIIINKSLGYKIEGRLNYFQLNTYTKEFEYSFEPRFTELKENFPSGNSLYEMNRKIAYRGSLKHFLKSLYSNSLEEEGFELYFNSSDGTQDVNKITDLNKILSPGGSQGRKVIAFNGYLIIRYGLEISTIKLRYPKVSFDSKGNTVENSPFELSGRFSSNALSELLPESYNDNPVRAELKTDRNILHEEIDGLLEKAERLQAMKYELFRDSIKSIALKYPDSTKAQLKFAAVLEKSAGISAEHIYEDIIEKDTSNSEVFYRLGKLKADEFNEFNGSIRKLTHDMEQEFRNNIGDTVAILHDQLADAKGQFDQNHDFSEDNLKVFLEAENCFKKAIRLNPAIDDYYISLSFLYEDKKKFSEAIETLEEMLKQNNESKIAHLTLGMLYFRNQDYKKSRYEYDLALSLMSAAEKNDFMFNSAKLLLEPVIGEKYASLDEIALAQTIKKFWETEDPMLLTDFNERLLEHYSRVAYANLRFGSRDRTVPGWKTERGEILLRYGFPEKVLRYRPYNEISKSYGLEMKAKTEVWYYTDMLFSFYSPYYNGNYQLSSPSAGPISTQVEVDSKLFADNLKKKSFEKYQLKVKGEALDCAFRVYQFKDLSDRDAGKTDMYFSLSVPGLDSSGTKLNPYKWGLYYFDSRFDLLNSIRDSLIYYNSENVIRTSGKDNLVLVRPFSEAPKTLNLAAEILRDSDNGAFSSHNRMTVSDFKDSKRLMLSDIVITPKVEFGSGKQTAINRNGIWLLPNPKQSFNRSDSLHIYYEIYNLGSDIMGVNDYDQEINITAKAEGSLAIFGKLAGDALSFLSLGDKPSVTSSRLISHNKNHQICFQTTFGGLKKGKYTLTIKVKDKISGLTAENSTDFSVE